MTTAFSRLADASPPEPAKPHSHLASWYTPGLSDALGDRLLMFDNTTASPLELLRFKPELSGASGFETALRERVEELAGFEHESLAKIRAVKWLGDREGLALISNQAVGRRLSEVLGQAQGSALALELIRQLSPVLAALHERGIAHGALTPERIVIAPDGRVILCEHVLGSALDSLNMPSGWLRTELGIAVPSGNGRIPLDGRSDVVQLGFIALSLALGKRLEASSYPEKVGLLIDESVGGSTVPPALRRWMERALHMVWPPFASAMEATAALAELPDATDRSQPQERDQTLSRAPILISAPQGRPAESPERAAEHRTDQPSNVISMRPAAGKPARQDVRATPPAPPVVPVEAPVEPFFPDETQLPPSPPAPGPQVRDRQRSRESGRFESEPPVVAPVPAPPPAPTTFVDLAGTSTPIPMPPGGLFGSETESPARAIPDIFGPPAKSRGSVFTAKWFVAALLIISISEAAIIGGLLFSRPSVATEITAQSAPTDPPAAPGAPQQTSSEPAANRGSAARPAAASASTAGTASADRAPAGGTRTGTVRFESPLVLEVFEKGNRIGTTAAPLTLANGRHTLELVNEPLGYRATQTITVANGRSVSRTITLPQGRLNVNASPWALVSIDGKPVGETPLANLAVTIGPHEVTFRHPMLGEQRQTAIVKTGGVTRISANLQR